MNLAQQLKEKNNFLRKAYEVAFGHSPSSPLSVDINPIVFGKTIGYDEATTERIMNELVDDGYVNSSIGMGSLMVTHLGLSYLREIEDEPMTPSNISNNSNSPILSLPSKQSFMKQSEKLDLMLRELYKYKNNGSYYSLSWICQTIDIPIESDLELNRLAHRLKNDGYINTQFTHNDCNAELTTYGIEYCEEDSYSYSGSPIVTNNYSISITNSPNSNIVSQANNVTITQNISEVGQAIEKIREVVTTDLALNRQTASDILECLNEIQDTLKGNKMPKFAVKSLIDITGGISSIASWVVILGQFAGLIPIPGQ
jgi:hypothetical protein